MSPPSYSSPTSQSLVMTVAPIPLTIPRPFYWTPLYNYHGLTFDMLPPTVQSFLASRGIATREQYSADSVAFLRASLTDQLARDVRGVSEAIAHTTVRYNFMRTVSPACDPALGELVAFVRRTLLPTLERQLADHLAFADGLVWADVAARGDLSTEQALHYRFQQTQPALEMVATHLVELYEWSAQRWMMGWRTTYLEAQTEPQTVFYESPVFNAPGPPQFDAGWGGPPQPDAGASPRVKDAAGVNLQVGSHSPRSPPTCAPPSAAPQIAKGPSSVSSIKGSAASVNHGRRRWGNSALRKARV
ncbi:hypothetical protein C8R46DRAFT_1194124 [Mycena filopes]|nr:hypothetical protein C8R46DRAFT_1194124 [Mycena filopes]